MEQQASGSIAIANDLLILSPLVRSIGEVINHLGWIRRFPAVRFGVNDSTRSNVPTVSVAFPAAVVLLRE